MAGRTYLGRILITLYPTGLSSFSVSAISGFVGVYNGVGTALTRSLQNPQNKAVRDGFTLNS